MILTATALRWRTIAATAEACRRSRTRFVDPPANVLHVWLTTTPRWVAATIVVQVLAADAVQRSVTVMMLPARLTAEIVAWPE